MQACNRQGVYCVPLYDTLGENAVEYILDHSESTITFISAANMGMPCCLSRTTASSACPKFVSSSISALCSPHLASKGHLALQPADPMLICPK